MPLRFLRLRLAPRALVASGLALAPAGGVLVVPAPAHAADPRPKKVADLNPAFLDAIPAAFRPAVAATLRAPTLSAKAAESAFVASPGVYQYLVDHPDRTALVWQRLAVPCVPITELPDGRFAWTDDNGSRLTWRVAAKFTDGVVWLANGNIKAGSLMPVVPVQAVAVLKYPPTPAADDPAAAALEPAVTVYLQTDSRAAATVLRIAGPAAPRLAEQGAEQLLLFFSGPARYLYAHPGEADTLLKPAGK